MYCSELTTFPGLRVYLEKKNTQLTYRMIWIAPSVFHKFSLSHDICYKQVRSSYNMLYLRAMAGVRIFEAKANLQPSLFQQESYVTLVSRIWQSEISWHCGSGRKVNQPSVHKLCIGEVTAPNSLHSCFETSMFFNVLIYPGWDLQVIVAVESQASTGTCFFSFSIYLPIHIFGIISGVYTLLIYPQSVCPDWDKGGLNPKWTRLKAYTAVELLPGV